MLSDLYRAEQRQREAPNGLRTDWVTLEIKQFSNPGYKPPSEWPWAIFLHGEALTHGESVRVVEEPERLEARVSVLQAAVESARAERDDAARNRDRLHGELGEVRQQLATAILERESLREQLESVACRAAAAETALESSPAASGAAGTEVVAWGVRRNGEISCVTHRMFRSMAQRSVEQFGGTVIPLYAAPQPAPGWLTAEEREVLELVASDAETSAVRPRWKNVARVIHALLARSSPPEVVRPKWWEDIRSVIGDQRDADWLAALAGAGVTVKEVG